MSPRIRSVTWFCAAAAVVSWLIHLLVEEEESLLAAIAFSTATVLLVLVFAFRSRFSGLQRFGAGAVVVIALIAIGLLVFAAGMAGLSSIR